MDVTNQLNARRMTMGASGSSRPEYLSPSKTLDFAKGSNSLTNANTTRISAIPQVLNYKDTVGLFGAENVFIKIDLDVLNAVSVFVENDIVVNTYIPAFADFDNPDLDLVYDPAVMDFNLDIFTVNTYEPAQIDTKLDSIAQPLISINLENLKTGNKYIDAWFDVRIYTKDREEYPYDFMYINPNSYFYIGFHARNTKRLPYNVRMTVGDQFLSAYDLTPEQRRYLVN